MKQELEHHNIYEAEKSAQAVSRFVQKLADANTKKAHDLQRAVDLLKLVEASGFLPEGGEPAELVKAFLNECA